MPLDKYNLHNGSHGPSTTELQTFLNEKFNAGLDEEKFGVFGPLTEAAVNKVLETLGMEQNGVFGPEAYAASLKHLETADSARAAGVSEIRRKLDQTYGAPAKSDKTDDDDPDMM